MSEHNRQWLRVALIVAMAYLLVLLASMRSDAQSISGQVLDGNGAGVSGVLATLRQTNRTFAPVVTRSDNNGLFAFKDLAAGQYFVQLTSTQFIFTPAERVTTLKAGSKSSLKFWAIPLPASALPVPVRITDADVISIILGGVAATSASGSLLRIEFKSGAAPLSVPFGSIVGWGYVPPPPR